MTQEQLDALLTEDLAALDTEGMEIPESFRTGWRQAVEEEAQMMKPSWPKKAILRMCSLAAALVFVVGGTLLTRDQLHLDSAPQEENGMVFTSRTSAKMAADYDGGGMMLNSTYGAVEEAAYEMAVNDTIALGAAANTLPQPETEKKIIRTIDISLTTTNFEGDLAAVQALCESLGGWVEYIYQYGDTARGELRWGNLTLRIPSGQLDTIKGQLGGIGRVTSLSESATDVTASYQDTQARLATQQAKMDRLQALLKQAEDVADLIEIESAIADTQYQLDTYQSRLNSTDRQVDYSTVTVSIREEKPADTAQTREATLWERLTSGLEASLEELGLFLQDMVVFLIAALPWVIILAVVVLGWKLGKKIFRKKK